jgi:mono/diheme cytochrome c family protein
MIRKSTCSQLALGVLAFAFPFASVNLQAADTSAAQPTPTFTKDIAPILNANCVRCHQPGEIAPMALQTYTQARPWARSIKERVLNRTMPPWFLDRNIGIQHYKNNPALSEAQIATIVKWVDGGAPQGNLADMPPPEKTEDASTWRIGTPDLIINYPEFTMPAKGADLFGEIETPTGLKEDRYIMAIQSKVADSDSRKVVHHALSFAVDPGSASAEGGACSGGCGQFLVEYASGKNATFYDDGTGVLLRAGQNALASYHYHSVGEQVKVHLQLGIKFYPKGYVPQHVSWSKQLGQDSAPDLDIPAGQIVRRDGYTWLTKPAVITAWQPHMHIRGKYQCLELIYPVEPVVAETVTCAGWNFNWHTIYNYDDDVQPIVPAGTLLHVISWYDNTAANKFNPDAKNWVGAGTGRTIDEMGFSWIGWYELTDPEYKAAIAARKAKMAAAEAPAGKTVAALK